MITASLQKIISWFLSFLASVSLLGGIRWADGMDGHDMPIIPAEVKAEEDVRVLSLNVRNEDNNGVPAAFRRTLAVRALTEMRPDSFGLQEVTPVWMAALRALLPEYGSVGVFRDNGLSVLGLGEACPIFYLKEKYTLADHGDFWLSETPEKPSYGPEAGYRRVCTWALLQDRETGALYAHVNTHFDNKSGAARVFGAELVCDFIREKFPDVPVVFTADMNAAEGSEPYLAMAGLLSDARYAAADCVARGTWHECTPEKYPNVSLDYIFCSAEIGVNAFRVVTEGVDGRFISDHFPLYADISLPAPAAQTETAPDAGC